MNYGVLTILILVHISFKLLLTTFLKLFSLYKKCTISFFLRFFFHLLASSFPFLKCISSPTFFPHLSPLYFPSSLGFLKDLTQCGYVSSHVVSISPSFWELRPYLHACIGRWVCAKHYSFVRLFAALWTVVHQAPLSMGFSRQEHWNGLPCLPPGDLLDPGIEPGSPASPASADEFFTTSAYWKVPISTYLLLMAIKSKWN